MRPSWSGGIVQTATWHRVWQGLGRVGAVTLGTHVLWEHRAGSRSFLAIEDCLGGGLVEQVTFAVGFEGWLGIQRLEKSRDESQGFFQLYIKSCVHLHT